MVGRPTNYTEDILTKTKEYLTNYEQLGDKIPSIAGLATHLQIARSTIYEWANQEDKQDFSDTLESILSKQENVLLNKGLVGDFTPTITKLALSNNHGYKEKSDVTSDDKPIENKTIVGGLNKVYGEPDEVSEGSEE